MIKLFGKTVTAIVVEVSTVHIENQFTKMIGVRFQTAGGDHALLFQLCKHFFVRCGWLFVMHVHFAHVCDDIGIGIGIVFSFVVFFCVENSLGFQHPIACKSTVFGDEITPFH